MNSSTFGRSVRTSSVSLHYQQQDSSDQRAQRQRGKETYQGPKAADRLRENKKREVERCVASTNLCTQ